MKWSQVRNSFIYLDKTKTMEPQQITVNDDLQALFDKIKSVRTSFKTALKRANIQDFKFHDLRHTFASQLIMKGRTLKDVQELLGHKTMTLRYAHLTQEHKKKAVNLLNGLTAPKNDECHKTVTSTNETKCVNL